MHKFKALVVLNLKAMLNSFRFGGRTRGKLKAASGIGAMALMAFLGLYLSGIYSFLFASQFAPIGMVHLVIMMMAALSVIMGVVFTIFAAQGIIFGGRDNDLMLALPVSAFQLMLARTMALYLENLIFSVMVMLPAGVAYLSFGGEGGVVFMAALILCTVFLALLPTVLAIVVGFALAWCSSKFGRRALVSNILYVGAFVLVMVFVFRLNIAIQGITLSAALGIESGFSVWGVPFTLLMEATCQGDILSLLLFLALCALPFFLAVWLFAKRYKKIVTGLGAKSARSDYKLGTVAATDARRALLNKESKRFFGTPIYLFNTGIGLIFLLLGSGAALFFKGAVEGFLRELSGAGMRMPIMPMLCAGMAFMVSMTAVTASSVSLEGRQLWILKEAPVSVRDIFAVKVGFQLLLELPCVLIAALCLGLAFGLGVGGIAVLFAVNAALALFCALFGLYINLCFPKLDCLNDALVVKQSAAAMLGTFIPMLACLLLGLLWYLLQRPLGDAPALLVCAALCALAAAVVLRLLNTRGRELWLAL